MSFELVKELQVALRAAPGDRGTFTADSKPILPSRRGFRPNSQGYGQFEAKS
jgi:hypothetical protein